MRRRAVQLAIAAVLAAVPSAAQAANVTRYVSPRGGDSGSCRRAAPCSIAFGINGAGSKEGDTVVVLPGTYTDQPIVLTKGLTIAGPEAAARPVLRTTGTGGAAITIGAGSSGTMITHLAIRATGDGAIGLDVQDTAALDDLDVRTTTGVCLTSSATGVRIDDSSFTETGIASGACVTSTGDDTEWNGVDVEAINVTTAAALTGNGKIYDSDFTGQVTGLELADKPDAHRVTAIGAKRGISMTGSVFVTDSVAIARDGGSAVYAAGGNHQLLNLTAWGEESGSYGIRALDGAVIGVKNTIARGVFADISADPATTTITEECETFTGCPAGSITVDHSNFVNAPGVQDLGSNSSADPKFADALFEDFHLRRGSPAIDAASFEFNSGSADRDGKFRWLGKAPDMGAYEYAPPHKNRAKADTVAPTLKRVFLDRTRFRITRAGSAFSAQAGARGTTLHFTITEASDLVITVARPGKGKPIIGTMVRPFGVGAHRMTISGELDHHFLSPGRYVMTVIARDIAQNLSRERRIPFTIIR
jgi:hypothetical protein